MFHLHRRGKILCSGNYAIQRLIKKTESQLNVDSGELSSLNIIPDVPNQYWTYVNKYMLSPT
jgi:hypothetical protein